MGMKRVLDKIRFAKTFPKYKTSKGVISGYEEYNKHFEVAINLAKAEELKPRYDNFYQTSFHKTYKGKSEKTALHFSFGSGKQGPYIGIECTPYKFTDDEWIDVRALFTVIFGGPEVIAKIFRLSEIELAVDIPQKFNDLIFIAPRFRSQNAQSVKLGTLEIGSKKGGRWIRIYDKKKQLQQAKGIHIPAPLTRIEYVRRRLKFSLASWLGMPNPFNEILVVPRHKVGEIKKIDPSDFIFSHFAKKISDGALGLTAYWSIEDADMRKVIRKKLAPHALNIAGTKTDWDAWINSEINILRNRFKPDK